MAERGGTRDYRRRLMEGMAAAVAERGYADTTIADIVRHARVSRRTFYEQFSSKQECLLALYVAASERVIRATAAVVETAGDRDTQIARATEAYLARMQANPVLTRTLFLEILAAGPAGLQVRREINQRYADLFRGVVQADGGHLSPELAAAAVGGINELILQAVLDDRVDRLAALVSAPATQLLRAVLSLPPSGST
ncbi:TetR/AcrR family transcriptional regulator [Longimicrobium sp.]|uniref:TetR/AcrR family transcriptional regulator n=1 Tax=Longimicrobium sp. TaxID=2029185 RepID=UPI002E3281AD|nr:TetR/AcrR family transcriptional regulator [Longimicrobium sp.]HEX6042424.1 TetR/AcrR family transcriptional regulator [Longimicrobium sp.]